MKERPAQLIADVLLNQRVMAGIGNVYKSEVLFAVASTPSRPSERSGRGLTCLIATGRKFLLANVHTSLAPMTTYAGYQRTHDGTRQCERAAVGLRPRRPTVPPLPDADQAEETRGRGALTYWCPKCQIEKPASR